MIELAGDIIITVGFDGLIDEFHTDAVYQAADAKVKGRGSMPTLIQQYTKLLHKPQPIHQKTNQQIQITLPVRVILTHLTIKLIPTLGILATRPVLILIHGQPLIKRVN